MSPGEVDDCVEGRSSDPIGDHIRPTPASGFVFTPLVITKQNFHLYFIVKSPKIIEEIKSKPGF